MNTSVIWLTVLILIVAWLVNEYNDTRGVYEPNHFEVQHVPLEGALAPKLEVRNIELIADGKIDGPESFVLFGGAIYTGTNDGKLHKIVDGQIVKTITIVNSELCRKTDCARPLGIRHWKNEQFAFADQHLGIFVADFHHGTVKQIFSSGTLMDDWAGMFSNDIDFIDNHTVIFSDMSAKCGQRRFALCFLEHVADGRLIKLDLLTGHAQTLVKGLVAPNGVQVHHDRHSVLFSKMTSGQVMRFYFAGAKKGRLEVFADVPGMPDNIRVSSKGNTYWIALYAASGTYRRPLLFSLGSYPFIRRLLGYLPENLRQKLWTANRGHNIIVELGDDGKVLRSFHEWHDALAFTTEVHDDGEFIYGGSFDRKHLVKFPIPVA